MHFYFSPCIPRASPISSSFISSPCCVIMKSTNSMCHCRFLKSHFTQLNLMMQCSGVPDLLPSSLTVTRQYRTALVCPTAAFFLLQVWLGCCGCVKVRPAACWSRPRLPKVAVPFAWRLLSWFVAICEHLCRSMVELVQVNMTAGEKERLLCCPIC